MHGRECCSIQKRQLPLPVVLAFTALCFDSGPTLANSLPKTISEPLVTDRPDQTESSLAVPPGAVQIEFGVTRTGVDGAGAESKEFAAPQTLVRVGVIRGLEIRVGFDGIANVKPSSLSDNTGVRDSELGAKLELASAGDSKTSLALLGSISLPTGEHGFSAGGYFPSARISVAHDLSETFSLGFNWGIASREVDASRSENGSFGSYTVAVGASLAQNVGVYVEAFGDVRIDGPSGPAHSLDGGITYLLADKTQLDFSGGVGLSESAENWYISSGLSFRLFR